MSNAPTHEWNQHLPGISEVETGEVAEAGWKAVAEATGVEGDKILILVKTAAVKMVAVFLWHHFCLTEFMQTVR